MAKHDYIALGRRALLDLVEREHAVVFAEVEAKIAETRFLTIPTIVDPHHLTTVRRELTREGILVEPSGLTKGGRQVAVLEPADTRGRKTKIAKAAQRKRLLHSRYQGWALGSATQPNLIGRAGERVVHDALTAAAPHGYLLARPEGGDVATLLGALVPRGPLDNAAFLTVLRSGVPQSAPYLVTVEVKNLRQWVYPHAPELYQLLTKSSALQVAHPEQPIVPVFVCRRAHQTLFYMARDLGFIVVDLQRQFVLPDKRVTAKGLLEVRSELGYTDIAVYDGKPFVPLVKRFVNTLPRVAEDYSKRWAVTAPALADRFLQLRSPGIVDRPKYVDLLRQEARLLPNTRVGW